MNSSLCELLPCQCQKFRTLCILAVIHQTIFTKHASIDTYIHVHSDQILMYAIVFQVVKGKRYWEDGGMGKKKMGEGGGGAGSYHVCFGKGCAFALFPGSPH